MVFARKYLLTDPTATHAKPGLTRGAIIGIALGTANAVLFAVLVFFWMRRRAQRRKQAEDAQKSGFIPRTQEMEEPHDITRPSELASPQSQPITPHTASTQRSANWPMVTASPPPKMMIPQELPGSTYIYEHHPAFDHETSDRTTTSAPSARSEPRTPGVSEPRTPGPSEPRTPTKSPVTDPSHPPTVISPLISPK